MAWEGHPSPARLFYCMLVLHVDAALHVDVVDALFFMWTLLCLCMQASSSAHGYACVEVNLSKPLEHATA